MRTKTLLLTAVLGVATAATSMGQVFSQNIVGYVNVVLRPGFNLIANPLNGTNNGLNTIIPNPGVGSFVYKFTNPGGFSQIAENGGPGLWDVNLTLAPGEGAFISVPALTTNTFVGEVLTGTRTNDIPTGFSIRSSIVPQSGALDTVLGFPAAAGDFIYRFANPGGYSVFESGGGGLWDPTAPVPAVGESFWINNPGAAKSWVRTFNP